MAQFEIEDYDDGELETGVTPNQRPVQPQQPPQQQTQPYQPQQPDPYMQPQQPVYDMPPQPPKKVGKLKVFGQLFWYYKKTTLPLTALLLLLLLLAIPATRYPMVGLVLRRHFDVQLIDAKTGLPVSGATVSLGDKQTETDNQGKARLSVRVGGKPLTIEKKYYQSLTEQVFVGINVQKQPYETALSATGRQVPLTVLDRVSSKPVANATIKVLDTSAATDKNGKAFIVLPTDRPEQAANVSADKYNNGRFTVQVTDKSVPANTVRLTPSGRVTFLSNASGQIEVATSNYDGSDRKTLVQGTGNEDEFTRLFVSPDLKHAALLARRDAGQTPKLHIIDVSNGTTKVMDNALAVFEPVGWAGDRFVYVAERKDLQAWQANRIELKSYSPAESNVTVLDKSAGEGESAENYASEQIQAVNVVDGAVVYAKAWQAGMQADGLANRQNVISRVQPDGKGRETLRTIQLAAGSRFTYVEATRVKPQTIYYRSSVEGTTVYYAYQEKAVNQVNTITLNDVTKQYPTYFVAPAGKTSYWSEVRDGQTIFFLGDANGGEAKQIAQLKGYQAAGWHSDGYVLLSKDNQLYIMATNGLAKGQEPVKIANYFTPKQQP